MGNFYVPSQTLTPADRVREALDKAERKVPSLRGAGPEALTLLHLIDQAVDVLAELEASGMDVRAERSRLETVQGQLGHYRRRFLAEVGSSLQEERAAVRPDRAHWWWFLDEAAAQERKQQLYRALRWAAAAVLVLVVAWFVYDRFIAPPPQVRQALNLSGDGETLIQKGDLRTALARYEAASALVPDDPEYWLWQGVLHVELHEPDQAEEAFVRACSLYGNSFDFLVQRAMAYSRVNDLEAANADADQAIREDPNSGVGYYVRGSVDAARGDYILAIADLEQASQLASAAGDAQLEAAARYQMAMIMQLQAVPQFTPEATPAP